jgi:hypothetical protein
VDPSDPARTIDGIHQAWERAETRYRDLPSDSPLAGEALTAVTDLWDWYERELGNAIGQGKVKRPKA